MTESGTGRDAPCGCKVGRVAADHGLAGIHDELERQWGESGDVSVRELTRQFNERVLRSGFERAGRIPIDGEVGNVYRVLTDDEVDAGSRTRARERLREEGVAVAELERQFVSHQTVYRHLVDCLGVTSAPSHEDEASLASTWRDRIQSLGARTARVAERGVEQLRAGGAVSVGSVEVLVDVTVVCRDCGSFYTFEELLEERACECDRGAD
jgi:MOSC domain-containing protein YiiM